LQNKKAFQQVSDQFIKRIARVAETHKGRLIKEAHANPEMVKLLKKAQQDELSAEEKLKMRDMIIVIFKAIPNLTMVSLPQRFLTLPVLMKILPKDFFAQAIS
jgi:hypothetical protein